MFSILITFQSYTIYNVPCTGFYLVQHGLHSYVNVNIITSVLMGPPAVGKTSFKHLLFNLPPVERHDSTPIATVPVRAMLTSKVAEVNDGQWLDIDSNPEELFRMLADTIKHLAIPNVPVDTPDDPRKPEHLQAHREVIAKPPVVTDDTTSNIVQQTKVNTPTATEQSISTTPISMTSATLDPSEVQDIIDLLPHVEGSGELFESKWMYLLDTGGQMQFTDVSRAFIRTNAIYFILNKLTEKLSDRPDFCYSEDGKALTAPCKLHMTNLQLIKQFVSSIMSSKYEVNKEDVTEDESSSIVQPFVSIIGTCYDMYQKDRANVSESIDTKNEILLRELEEFLDHFIFDGPASDKLIHPVNNLCTGSERNQASLDLRKKLLLAIQDRLKPRKARIPAHQYLFDILVKNEIKSSGKESHDIGGM